MPNGKSNDPLPVEELFSEMLQLWRPGSKLTALNSLCGDASARRYYRLHLRDTSECVIGCIFDAVATPLASGDQSRDSFQAAVELSLFLREKGVPVPELYFSMVERRALLQEDLGQEHVADLFGSPEERRLRRALQHAIEIVLRLQAVTRDDDSFAVRRYLSREVLLREMSEFTDFVLGETSEAARRCLMEGMERLAAEVGSLPQALTHRDFHGWNLLLDGSEQVRVIDFQDALFGPRLYDIAVLLNDRDSDLGIGEQMTEEMRQAFADACGIGDEFYGEYRRVLLQRDLKVAGRFSRFVKTLGRSEYGRWIPNTLCRVQRTARELAEVDESYRTFASVLDEQLIGGEG